MDRLDGSVLIEAVTSIFPVSDATLIALAVLAAGDAAEFAVADGSVTV